MSFVPWNRFCLTRVLWHLLGGYFRELFNLNTASEHKQRIVPLQKNYRKKLCIGMKITQFPMFFVLVGLSGTILGYLGLSLAILGNPKKFQTISGYLGLSRYIFLLQAIMVYLRCLCNISGHLWIFPSSIKYEGATRIWREKVIVVWKFFNWLLFFTEVYPKKAIFFTLP